MSIISKYFVAALKAETGKRPRGTKKWLADQVSTTPSHITDILQERKYGSEEMKRAITAALGWSYEEFLRYGQCLVEDREYVAPESAVSANMEDYAQVPFIGEIPAAATRAGPALLKGGLPGILSFLGPASTSFFLRQERSKNIAVNEETRPDELKPGGSGQPLFLYKPLLGRHKDSRQLLAFELRENNMAPTIPAGAIVIIDIADREFIDMKLYLLMSGDNRLILARVKSDADLVILTNDNSDFPPQTLKKSWEKSVIGQVVRSCHNHD
jgi:hypothetical protein